MAESAGGAPIRGVPLYARILIGVILGIITGATLRERAAVLSDAGMLVITLLKTLATPLILFAVLAAFLRKLKDRESAELVPGLQTLEDAVRALFQMFVQMLEWIIVLIPFAVFGVVAGVIGRTGAGVFAILAVFLVTVTIGLLIHAVLYYSLLLRFLGRTSPLRFYAGASDAIVTALSCGSSLATLPVTLRCLND